VTVKSGTQKLGKPDSIFLHRAICD